MVHVCWISLLCLSIMQEMGRDRDCISPCVGHIQVEEHSLSSKSRARKHYGLNMQSFVTVLNTMKSYSPKVVVISILGAGRGASLAGG